MSEAGSLNIEVKLVDPATGGEKACKLQRYDLIPTVEWSVLRDRWADISGSGDADHALRTALGILDGWWLEGTGDPLTAGAWAARALYFSDEEGSKLDEFDDGGLPLEVEKALAEVFGFGAGKYSDDNWKKGYNWGWSYAAARRHLMAVMEGQWLDTGDKGSGKPHLAHFIWHCIVLHWYQRKMVGTDTREFREKSAA